MRFLFSILGLLLYTTLLSQNAGISKLDFELYGDFFINGTTNHQSVHKISDILYNYNRTNQFGINMAYLKSSYKDTSIRANLALMSGTYSIDNYSGEPLLFQNLLEGNVGLKLSKNQNTWLDVGVMPSHIGFESAVGYDCWNLTRSLLAENSPYYETGIKLTHTSKNEKFTQSYMLINGWQRITLLEGHSIPALGMQFTYKPLSNLLLNYSNFIGTAREDSIASLRIYHNMYAVWDLNKKWSLFSNLDIGSDKNYNDIYSLWYGAILSARYYINNKQSICFRSEFINDPYAILYPQYPSGWNTKALSANWDFRIHRFALFRAEMKYMFSNSPIFLPNRSNHLGLFLALQVKI